MIHRLFLILLLTLGTLQSQNMTSAEELYSLMPWPQKISGTGSDFQIDEDFTVIIEGDFTKDSRIYKAATRFIRYVTDRTGVFITKGFAGIPGQDSIPKGLHLYYGAEAELGLGTDESYTLEVTDKGIEIKAKTDLGAMHGLSSLRQLIEVKEGSYVFSGASVEDEPRFPWRGLMMDVARHFMPVAVVKRNLDAMALVKLNVFHWHLSDDQGFRVETMTLPELYRNASDGQYYTQAQIRDIVSYADDRGIRVIPEFDVPGHGTAFLTAYPELGSRKGMEYSLERFAGVFDPTLDPTREQTYAFLDALIKEVAPLFPDEYFHIGGDENAGKDWNESEPIQEFMRQNQLKNNHELQTYFNIKLEKILNKYGKKMMGWEEIMTEQMPTTALIHSWRGVNEGMEPGESLVKAVRNGYQTILSNGYYIDLMLSVDEHYLTDPLPNIELNQMERERILGGEATMWSELVTPLTVDSRIWPRTAAIAERFWSPQEVRDLESMHKRLVLLNPLLEQVGIQHLRAREYLLRNISNYQDTQALRELTEISEPFKIYSRNAGGTQYRSYSPFTLFADACTSDAGAVRPFRALTIRFIATKDDASKGDLIQYLENWRDIDSDLSLIEPGAPLIRRIRPYSGRIAEISNMLLEALQGGGLTQGRFGELMVLLESQPDSGDNLDVELAITKELIELAEYLKK